MKAIKLVPLFLLIFLINSYTCAAQEEEAIEEIDEPTVLIANFKGMDKNTFVFTYTDTDGEESEMIFEKITPEVKKAFNFNDASIIGKKFKITYTTKNVPEKDDEDMLVSMNTIIALEKM
ncbi:hypothetical protein U8527_21590 [Kordia algicida OT-1]|uniref:Uncharacterized protein n=1 Tax=Kordia algicida OT-1 TaxID=391587 RepID=A9DQ40_9FLAO|nr:hypothetical protein [Kordia algicida]EDP96566.1 hypothetical protein KAOT1_15423 [Kordia algicida OT-1]